MSTANTETRLSLIEARLTRLTEMLSNTASRRSINQVRVFLEDEIKNLQGEIDTLKARISNIEEHLGL